MKKVFALAAMAMLVLASCKKDFTCECTADTNGNGSTTTEYDFIDQKKSDAEEGCEAQEQNLKQVDPNASCELQ